MTQTIETTWHFESTDERDAFISERWPERECTPVPGCYKVNGGKLHVFCGDVTFERKGST